MTTDEALVPSDVVDDRRRNAALLRAIGFDRLSEPERELALAIAKKYELDLLLKHAMIIEGRLFVSRNGLLWIAHRSGVLDGIEVTEPVIRTIPNLGEFWHCTATVWRRDMTRPFIYSGRYPTKGGNAKYAPEMAVKVAESMALRRAFNVSAPTVDERWDLPTVQADVDAVSTPQQPARSLAERVQERREEIVTSDPRRPDVVVTAAVPVTLSRADEDDEVTQSMGARRMEEAAPPTLDDVPDECGAEDASPMALGICTRVHGHRGAHQNDEGTWPG